MNAVSRKVFLDDYLRAIEDGDAALFIGAGLSRPSGFVDWGELMAEVAEDLELDVALESDLVAVAQYHVNNHGGRSRLNRLIIDEFTKGAQPSETHDLIATLPIRTVWTTNYDRLIEQAFSEAGRRLDIKVRQDDLKRTLPRRDSVLYKMHGDVMSPDEAVLTLEDYETYSQTREFFTRVLSGDLVEKTFLFAGFSFADPNIGRVLARVRSLLGSDPPDHYWLVRPEPRPKNLRGKAKADYEYRRRRQDLQIADLRRYGIQPVIMDTYAEVESIFRQLQRLSRRGSVFISGSAAEAGPFGQDRLDQLAFRLGSGIIREGWRLVSGIGLGIGGSVMIGAMDELYRGDGDVGDQTVLRPFPQEPPRGMTLQEFWSRYRHDLLRQAGFAVFVSGNKDDGAGNIIEADGVMKEFEIATDLGLFPIPIGATGYAARAIWETVVADLDQFFPGGGVKGHFRTLGSASADNDALMSAVLAIINRVRKRPGV